MSPPAVHGEVAAGFEPVREAFVAAFTELGETGAAFTAIVDGEIAVALWGGDGYGRDSLVHVYSVTKPFAACCVLALVGRGEIELDAPMARYWPEFAAAGKSAVTVRHMLSHQAGMIALRDPRATSLLYDWDATCNALAAEAPWFEPGTAIGEQALFYGHLCGELVRRVDGRTLGAFWREEIAGPWKLDAHIGLTADEQARVVDLTGEFAPLESKLFALAIANPPGPRDLEVVNGAAWRAAEIPAVNGHATATGVARFFLGLLGGGELEGVRVLPAQLVTAMIAGERSGVDVVLDAPCTWGLGLHAYERGDGFGMGGTGGSLGWADPDLGLAEAYVTRHMGSHDRAEALDAAVRAVLRSR